eukprot:scaffold330422_cov79-Tisochrysis_lutea.AAC.2
MPTIRLHTTHGQCFRARPTTKESGDGARLDGIAQGRARAVSLHKRHDFRPRRRVRQRRGEQGPLRLTVGSREAGTLAVLAHTAAEQVEPTIRRDAVASVERRRTTSLTPHVAIRARVEGMAVASCRKHACIRERIRDARQQHHAHANRQSRSALIQLHRAQRVVIRDQGRRASRVNRDARPVHPKHTLRAITGLTRTISEKSFAAIPTNTPVNEPSNGPRASEAPCNDLYPYSSNKRCWGSITLASIGDTLKKALSNSSASSRKAPCRARSPMTPSGYSGVSMGQRSSGTSQTRSPPHEDM